MQIFRTTCWALGLLAGGAASMAHAQAGSASPPPLLDDDTPPAAAAAAPAATTAVGSLERQLTTMAGGKPANIDFPRYDALKPAVAFWTRVFSQYSELQSVVHSSIYPNKVFTVLDYRDDAAVTDKFVLDKRRRKEEQDAKDHVDDVLKRVQAKQYAPETMTAEERRVYDLFADVPGADKFKKQIGTARVQRGLKERTEKALEVSNRYLPSMEQTFRGYSLPVQLTRLPLVESSFNLDAYSKSGAAGIWQFIPSSARIYMRLNEVVDDRRDPWTSTDAAARHLRDDYSMLQSWPLAITAYNHGRGGISRALASIKGTTLMDLIDRFDGPRFGFASRNYYAEFLAAIDVERAYRDQLGATVRNGNPFEFETVETQHYVPYETLRRLCGASDEVFQRLNPAYRPEVIEGKLYVPPGHLIRVPYGSARAFEVGYAKLGNHERFDSQRALYLLYRVKRGDTLGRIARDYGVSQSAILHVNDMKSANRLRIGQVLKVPPKTESRPGPVTVAIGDATPQQTLKQKLSEAREDQRENDAARHKGKPRRRASYRTHKVQSGQTLSGIAQRYDVSVADLRSANHLASNTIRVGQRLKVPLD